MSKGILYVVATPIGNLDDVTFRAIKVLQTVDLIAAEDTRHTRRLLSLHGIATPMLALHEHNEREKSLQLLDRLVAGESLALVSDAGTPLISDPGFPLVREATLTRHQGSADSRSKRPGLCFIRRWFANGPISIRRFSTQARLTKIELAAEVSSRKPQPWWFMNQVIESLRL